MGSPLYDAINKHIKNKRASFHTPGHGGVDFDDSLYSSAEWDITELGFSDNLQNPSGIILQAEREMAKAYGVGQSLFFASGCTHCIYTALAIFRERSDKIVLCGEAHKSFFSGCKLFGIEIIEIEIEQNITEEENFKNGDLPFQRETNNSKREAVDGQNNCDSEKTREGIEKLRKAIVGAGGVFVTSPDYFGRVKDVKKICEIAKAEGKLSIVDEAHGSHFVFWEGFPTSACVYADLVANSLHKTLPVMTGGAVLNINNASLFEGALSCRRLIISTSPNYMVLASMDKAREVYCSNGKKLYEDTVQEIVSFKVETKKYGLVWLDNDDCTRLVLTTKRAKEVYKRLVGMGIYADMAIDDKVVFIVTPQNVEKLELLKKALFGFGDWLDENTTSQISKIYKTTSSKINTKKSKTERFSKSIEYVPINEALGRTVCESVGIYPPGIPLIRDGEILHQERLLKLLENPRDLFGVSEGKIGVYIDGDTNKRK